MKKLIVFVAILVFACSAAFAETKISAPVAPAPKVDNTVKAPVKIETAKPAKKKAKKTKKAKPAPKKELSTPAVTVVK